MAEVFTEGHPEWLILDERENAGSFEIDVFTGSKPSTIIFRVEPDGDDETIEGSFRAYEAGGIVFEEGSRLRKITYNTGIGRLRRKITDNGLEPPLGTPIKGWKPFSILCTNPAFEGHWLAELAREYETSVAANERCLGVVIRSTMEDNPGLPKEHIEREKLKYKNDPIGYDMFILGRDGIKVDGRPVFVNDFKFELHVNKDLKYNPMLPIIRGLDWGYNYPACVWVQIDDVGRKNILAELQGREMEAQNFAKLVLDKSKQWFPLCHKWRDWGDPSGFFQTDKGVTA